LLNCISLDLSFQNFGSPLVFQMIFDIL